MCVHIKKLNTYKPSYVYCILSVKMLNTLT